MKEEEGSSIYNLLGRRGGGLGGRWEEKKELSIK